MKIAAQAGITPTEFLGMTPYELNIYSVAKNDEKLRMAYITAVWTSRWVWTKSVPTLEEILNEPKQKEPQDMLEQIKKMNVAFGGTTY